jgi:hypothetical protein
MPGASASRARIRPVFLAAISEEPNPEGGCAAGYCSCAWPFAISP